MALLRIGIWVMLSSTPETTMAKPLISVRLEQELADRLKDQAEKDRRTVSSYVRNLIADTLQGREERPHAA
jgi:predicted DNA-binding protein